VSVPNDQGRSTGTPATTAARVTGDGKRIFQMGPPVVIWWCWVALIAASLGDLVIQEHAFVSLRFAFGALALTGLVYGCTLWPRIITDDRGIEVRNPFRRFVIPWPAVRGIFLADSVEVQCARPMPKKDKTVYSWALSSPRRTRARAQLRAWQWDQGKRNRPAGYTQLPDQARNLVKMTTAEIMARELAALSDDARFKSVVAEVDLDSAAPDQDSTPKTGTIPEAGPRSGQQGQEPPVQPEPGPPTEVLSATWAWPPVLAIVLPAIGFVVTTLVK